MPIYEDPDAEHINYYEPPLYPPDGYTHLNVDDARKRVGWLNARKVIMTVFWLFFTVLVIGACILVLTVFP